MQDATWAQRAAALSAVLTAASILFLPPAQAQSPGSWPGYSRTAWHDALSHTAASNLQQILWSTPVDLAPQYSGSDLLIHYGSTLITTKDTVIVTVKTGASGAFQLEGHDAYCGDTRWVIPTDYVLPNHDWTPSCGSTLAQNKYLYIPAAGGTVLQCSNLDSATPVVTRLAFYGIDNYNANPSGYSGVCINTPITADQQGNIYFGFFVQSSNPSNLVSGLARISASGVGSWVSAAAAAPSSDLTIDKVAHNCAPGLTRTGKVIYVAVSNGNGYGSGAGFLLGLDSTTLSTLYSVRLKDWVNTTQDANVIDDGTESPCIGPDGDVYYGVLETPWFSNNDRGWMLHFNSTLSKEKTAGAFGWDDTASIVPASAVPGYTGKSSYLICTKYNNYNGIGTGNGDNRVAILDPKATEVDPVTGAPVMNEVITVKGVTPDGSSTTAVREWCINSAAIDPATKSALVNSEDGSLYRWDFTTNSLTQKVVLTSGIGEAYTPTIVGPDNVVYAINNATLFAVTSDVVNVTPSVPVGRGRITYDASTGLYSQTITLHNLNDCAVTGSIYLAFDKLTSGIQVNNSSTTASTYPTGSPVITVTPSSLSAGGRISVTVQFSGAAGATIQYVPRVLSGAAAP